MFKGITEGVLEINQNCWLYVGAGKTHWWAFFTVPNWACSDPTKSDRFETLLLVSNLCDLIELRQDPKMNVYVYSFF